MSGNQEKRNAGVLGINNPLDVTQSILIEVITSKKADSYGPGKNTRTIETMV